MDERDYRDRTIEHLYRSLIHIEGAAEELAALAAVLGEKQRAQEGLDALFPPEWVSANSTHKGRR
jgi:hypothetical protein